MIQRLKTEVAVFCFAVQFLTRIPIPSAVKFTQARFHAGVRYYPMVGLLVGALASGIFICAHMVFPAMIAVLLSTAAGLLITGAFHEDGLADTFDGIGGGTDRQRTLDIMKDSRIGTYGASALLLSLMIKVAALSLLPSATLTAAALLAGHCLSRLSSVVVIASSRYARDHGTGKPVAAAISKTSLIAAIATGAASCGLAALWWPPAALCFGASTLLVGHVAIRLLFERKLSGYTGDTLGAVQQVSEVCFYLGLAAWV